MMSMDLKHITSILGIDAYYMSAVLFPAVVNIALACLASNKQLQAWFEELQNFEFGQSEFAFTGILIAGIVAIALLANIFRIFSKVTVERIFFGKNHQKMPTVRFILPDSSKKSPEYKKRLIAKIKTDLKISIPMNIEEGKTSEDYCAQIQDAVGLIREKVRKSPDNSMYLRKNIRYGAYRNFIGGALMTIIVELIYAIYMLCAGDISAIPIAIIIFHIILTVFICYVLPKAGEEYATELYNTYLNFQKND